MSCILTNFIFCSNLVLVRPVVIATATLILLYMSGLCKRMIKQWQKNLVHPIGFELKHPKNQSQESTETMSTNQSHPGNIQINNQFHNPEVTKIWHNYMVSIIGPLTLMIPKLYEETNINFFAELLEFRIHIVFLGFIYLLSNYIKNDQLRNFVKTYYCDLFLNVINV